MKRLGIFFLVFGSMTAHADSGRHSVPDNPKWKEECGSCHIAYPPRFLTADDWQKLMEGLDKHFDANAVLDQKDSKEILDFLRDNAGFRKMNSAPSLRISDTPWFTHEHREISNNTWFNPAVKSRSNCVACHINAERGDWSERGIRVPGCKDEKVRGERHKHGEEREEN